MSREGFEAVTSHPHRSCYSGLQWLYSTLFWKATMAPRSLLSQVTSVPFVEGKFRTSEKSSKVLKLPQVKAVVAVVAHSWRPALREAEAGRSG